MNNSTSLAEGLRKVKGKLVVSKHMNRPVASPMNWKGDGIDHINIWEHSNDPLGKFLANGSKTVFDHKYFGTFRSVESFWKWIQSEERDDRIRHMSDTRLRRFSKSLKVLRIVNFKAIIMDAVYQKINTYPEYKKLLKESELPLDLYYLNQRSGVKIRPTFFNWFILGLEEIRSAIKENREPVFTMLLDRKKSDIYDFVLNKSEIKDEVLAVLDDVQANALINILEDVK